MKKVNICAGEELKKILERQTEESFIPFNEAMNQGSYTHELFSDEFCEERAKTHSVSVEEYKTKLKGFLNVIVHLGLIERIDLWFGEDEFCLKNVEVVVQTLKDRKYAGEIVLHTVDELSGDCLKTKYITF